MKCLVTGATGFIGRELCKHLTAHGLDVLALSRSGAALASGQRTLAVDLSKGEFDRDLLRGVDVVFHLAGVAHQRATPAAYQSLNHDATLELAQAAAEAGVKQFVFLSSVKAMGPPSGDQPRSEAQCAPPTDAYGRSKYAAEQSLVAAFQGAAMGVSIVRPALVYGDSAKGNLALMARAVRVGMPRPPAVGGRSMIALGDLVELLYVIACQLPRGLNTWIVSDGQRYSARHIHDLMRAALGRPVARCWLPLWAWRLAAFLRDGGRVSNGESTYFKLFGTELYCAAALQSALPWQPRLQLADVLGSVDVAAGEGEL